MNRILFSDLAWGIGKVVSTDKESLRDELRTDREFEQELHSWLADE